MQTLAANNPDPKGPVRDNIDKPTAEDPDNHNPPLKVPGEHDGGKMEVHGAATNHEDGAMVEAAEGVIKSTPQGP